MLKTIKNILKYKVPKNPGYFELTDDKNEDNNRREQNTGSSPIKEENKNEPEELSSSLKINLEIMKEKLKFPKNQDIIIREFKLARKINAFIIFVEGMVDKNIINNYILRQLMNPELFSDFRDSCAIDYIADNILPVNQILKEKKYEKVIEQILSGVTALFVDNCMECLLIETRGYEKRSIEQPVTEKVIKGAQEGFTENLRTNITLVRRIVKNSKLITEILPVDKTNKTYCALLYIDGIASPDIVDEVKRRIKSLDIDFISGNGMLEELIADEVWMPFPQIMTTERPDKTASLIMDGKVAIILDGSPFASAVPTSFFETIQSPEDFFLKWQYASFLRYIRVFGMILSLLLPALYVGITLYHQEMIPTELLNSIIKARENVPFPTIIELFIMELSFELIREGGLRVPGPIGNTLGIVGALILGQAAVQAQLVSPVLIIVVALTGISSFALPNYSVSFTLRILRFVFVISASILGFYGISFTMVILTGLACSIKSFGIPYFAPVAPKTNANPDIITLLPLQKQKIRPDFANPQNKYRAGNSTAKWQKEEKRGDKK